MDRLNTCFRLLCENTATLIASYQWTDATGDNLIHFHFCDQCLLAAREQYRNNPSDNPMDRPVNALCAEEVLKQIEHKRFDHPAFEEATLEGRPRFTANVRIMLGAIAGPNGAPLTRLSDCEDDL